MQTLAQPRQRNALRSCNLLDLYIEDSNRRSLLR